MKPTKQKPQKEMVIDATNATLGRLASYAAKQSLLGSSIVIVNCSDVLITGKKGPILDKYQRMRARGGSSLKGPNFPRQAFKIVKRTVRGMLSYKQHRGKDALKRVICYDDTPPEYESVKKVMAGREVKTKAIKLSEVSKLI